MMKKKVAKITFALVTLILFLSIISYHPQDPSLFVYSTKKVKNLCGPVGATISEIFFQLFGIVSYLIAILTLIICWFQISEKLKIKIYDIIIGTFFIVFLCSFIQLFFQKITIFSHSIFIGGIIGNFIVNFFVKYFNFVGAFLIIVCLLGISIIGLFPQVLKFKLPEISNIKIKKKEKIIDNVNNEKEFIQQIVRKDKKNDKKKSIEKETKSINKYTPPSENFLKINNFSKSNDFSEELEKKAQKLLDKFRDFNINGEIINIIKGPAVTLFEFKPDSGIKLSRITSLQNDITMALKAQSVRIVAPIPGKDVVGIEVSNEKRETVFFKEIVTSDEFKKSKSPLTLAIGKTIDGKPYISDLAKMPHLLIAGSTGSGKSVCINVLINSIIYKSSFEEVRFILIDPKKLELSFYNEIPHLLLPVISEPEKALTSLKWAIYEMERRYDLMTEKGVRDIRQLNEKVGENERLPYIVIIIDELADLMMIASKELETLIARLAQKARAAGIHLILATQRPSVDVITGIIKNNLPSRIAFKVTSRADSRTILDHMGAESLLGMGDMLFLPPGTSNVVRLQGAYISEEEILKIIDYLKETYKDVEFMEEEILSFNEENLKKDYSLNFDKSDEYDPIWDQAVDFVSHLEEVSISLLQRKFKIGYNRAAKIIEKMEEEGIVGPADGSKPRKVLIKPI